MYHSLLEHPDYPILGYHNKATKDYQAERGRPHNMMYIVGLPSPDHQSPDYHHQDDAGLPDRAGPEAPDQHNVTEMTSQMSAWTWLPLLQSITEPSAFEEVPIDQAAPWFWDLVDKRQELVQRGADDAALTWNILREAWGVGDDLFLLTMETYMNGVIRALHQQSTRSAAPQGTVPTETEEEQYVNLVVQTLVEQCRASAPMPSPRARPTRRKRWWGQVAANAKKARAKNTARPRSSPESLACRTQGEQVDSDATSLVAKKWILKPRKVKQAYETSKQIWRSARPDRRTVETRRLEPRATPRSLLSRRCSSAPWAMEEVEMEAELPEVEPHQTAPLPDHGGEAQLETESAHRLWLVLLGLVPDGDTLGITDLDSLPMTLPPDIVGNIRETLSDQSAAELEELRAAVPEVLERISEEVLGLLDEASGSSSSAARPSDTRERTEEEPAEEEADNIDLTNLMQRTLTGVMKHGSRKAADDHVQLHQELQGMTASRASTMARRLQKALGSNWDYSGGGPCRQLGPATGRPSTGGGGGARPLGGGMATAPDARSATSGRDGSFLLGAATIRGQPHRGPASGST